MGEDYFERLAQGFETNQALGIASGSAWELVDDGAWSQRFVTGGRSGRHTCLQVGVPSGRAAARAASRMGRHRSAEGAIEGVGDTDVHRPTLPTSPQGGQPRRVELGPLARERRHRVLHGLPALVSGRPHASPPSPRSSGHRPPPRGTSSRSPVARRTWRTLQRERYSELDQSFRHFLQRRREALGRTGSAKRSDHSRTGCE